MTADLIDAERCTLSAVMQDTEALIKANEIVTPQDFYSEKHQTLFKTCLDVYNSGQVVDLVTVTDKLVQRDELKKCGGASYVSQVAAIMPTATAVKYHANLVRKASVVRRVNLWAKKLAEHTDTGVENLGELFGTMQSDIVSLADTVREKRSPLISNIVVELAKQWDAFAGAKSESKQEKKTGKYCGVPLFKPINAESPIPYYMPGHLWMLAGYTSAGKSTALAQLICDACSDGARVLGFSLEESRTTKAVKMIANITDIPQKYLLTGEIHGNQFDAVRQAMDLLNTWNVLWYDDVRTLDEICLKSKKHSMQGGVDIIAVDYVQNIQGNGDSIYNDMRSVGPRLLDLANELGATVVALSQVTNESMRGDSEIIGLKGAGELAAAADIVLWLKRVKGQSQLLDCEIRKNRAFGETGIMELQFTDRYTRIKRRAF